MKATVIIDNIPGCGLLGEWGLCVYIEYNGVKVLLDTGATSLFKDNAAALSLPLEQVDFAVLSHAHWDHAGGMEPFFRVNDRAEFYVQESTAPNCYDIKPGDWRYIGIPKTILTDYPDRIHRVGRFLCLSEGIYLLAHTTPRLDLIGKREHMYQRNGRRFSHDNFSHEQSLIFDTDQGLVIFNSCSHGGAANIILEVQQAFPDKSVRALIGGFHLYNKTDEEIRFLAGKIKETGISYLCTGHCTGDNGYAVLQEELGDILHRLQVGLVMTF